jgi:transcriptional regulator with XRE-family HTH domain
MSFSARLRAERSRLKLTQEQFGELGGVKRVTQYLYEQDGGRVPDINYLLRLNEHAVDVVYLVLGHTNSGSRGRKELSMPSNLAAFRAVDEFARDKNGDLLPYIERERFFQFLCAALSDEASSQDMGDLKARLRRFVGT